MRPIPRFVVVGVAACLCVFAGGVPAHPQSQYQPGVFVATSDGAVELTAFAELVRQDGLGWNPFFESGHRGPLRMVQGQLDDAPVVNDVAGVLVNLTGFQPAAVMASTAGYFAQGEAERRAVPIHIKRIGLWTFDVRASDLEQPDGVRRLLATVRASDETPGYFFVVIGGHQTMLRFYPFRVR